VKSGGISPIPIGVLRLAAVGDCKFAAIETEIRMIACKNAVITFTIVFLSQASITVDCPMTVNSKMVVVVGTDT